MIRGSRRGWRAKEKWQKVLDAKKSEEQNGTEEEVKYDIIVEMVDINYEDN